MCVVFRDRLWQGPWIKATVLRKRNGRRPIGFQRARDAPWKFVETAEKLEVSGKGKVSWNP